MSLYHKPQAFECLWAKVRIPVREPVYGHSYVRELDSGAWDEVQVPWTVDVQEDDREQSKNDQVTQLLDLAEAGLQI